MASSRSITVVLGGVRSGKSRYAEALASRFSRVTYVATARRSDAEMRRRIAAHRRVRPKAWRTVEASVRLDAAIRRAGADADVLLIDCLTTYCGSLVSRRGIPAAAREHMAAVVATMGTVPASIIVVSNEVGSGVVPAYASGRAYRDFLGEVNQQMAAAADAVVWLVAGIPVVVKGTMA